MLINKSDWIDKCKGWKKKWPVFQQEYNNDTNGINIYKFIEVLNHNLKPDSVICWDAGSSLYTTNQGLKLNGAEQRSIGSLAQAEMGAALAMSAGISSAKNHGEVICIIGDGSFNTNPQALSIIRKHNLPVKIFVLNNNGYLSIKNTQDKFFNGHRIGTCINDGLFFPKILNIAKTYEIDYYIIDKITSLDYEIKICLNTNKPLICEVICQEQQEISPGITAIKTDSGILEQCDFSKMSPFLSDEEYNNEMIID